jgi:putative membrane protein
LAVSPAADLAVSPAAEEVSAAAGVQVDGNQLHESKFMKLLSEDDHKAIETAVRNAESTTSGEIVFAVAETSANYQHATLQGAIIGMAAAAAIYLMLPIAHTTTSLLWTEVLSFAVFLALLPRVPWRRWIISKQEMDARVKEAALMQFYASGLYRTRESNGVEIYLSLFEREVVVIGDTGIHAKMGDQHWNSARDLIIRGIKNGEARKGICDAIEACGKALAEHFPRRHDDVNELPDSVITRPLRPDAP